MVYARRQRHQRRVHFEVDSTESVWYKIRSVCRCNTYILKLTPQSQYGIGTDETMELGDLF